MALVFPGTNLTLLSRPVESRKLVGESLPVPAKEIDARDCFVAPGAIDLHTHYDGQLNWDPYCTISGWFGVTSLTIGQCGFGFAPTRPEDRELNMAMMNRIEAIPLESMRQGMRWDWESFPEYLDSLDRQGLGVNIGALFPFSPLRGYVLGMKEARVRTTLSEQELNEMKRLFREGMEAGAFGFATDLNTSDRPEDGGWLPSHVASDEEYLSLAEIMNEFGVGHLGWTIGQNSGLTADKSPEKQRQLIDRLVDLSGRPLHVGLDRDSLSDPWIEKTRSEGRPIFVQDVVEDTVAYYTLAEYNLFDFMPNWVQPLIGSPEERMKKLRNPDIRAAMKNDIRTLNPASNGALRVDWEKLIAIQVLHERNFDCEGYSIAEIATMKNKDPFDAFLDLALDEDLQTEFTQPIDAGPKAENLTAPFSHISVSDGGAHVRFLTISSWPVDFLTQWIRDREIMTLEQAHQKMSALPA